MRIYSRLFALGTAVVLTAATPSALAAFKDVPADHINAEAIAYVQDQKIVSGYPDGTYQPGKVINRAEFTKLITTSALTFDPAKDPLGTKIGPLTFSDLQDGAWYIPYVRKAVEAKVVSGYPNGTFQPTHTINAAEAAKILVRAFGIHVVESDGVWYRPYIRALAVRDAIPLSVRTLEAPVTRGEMAEFIYRLSAGVHDKPSRTAEELLGENEDHEVGGRYRAYRGDVIGNGRISVLFFHADWCPVCRAADAKVDALYSDTSRKFVDTYKVHFDTEGELKARYGVTSQHTFVKIDGAGVKIRAIESPTDAELIDLLMVP